MKTDEEIIKGMQKDIVEVSKSMGVEDNVEQEELDDLLKSLFVRLEIVLARIESRQSFIRLFSKN
jgi:hypothetical protein